MNIRSLAALANLTLLSACGTIDVATQYDRTLDFSIYRTFSWVPERTLLAGASSGASPLLEDRLKAATTDTLTAKGYTYVPNVAQADFAVSFVLGTQESVSVSSYPSSSREPGAWIHPAPDENLTRSSLQGTLNIDLFDVTTRKPFWHGQAMKTIAPKDRDNPAVINRVVTAVLAEFPSR